MAVIVVCLPLFYDVKYVLPAAPTCHQKALCTSSFWITGFNWF